MMENRELEIAEERLAHAERRLEAWVDCRDDGGRFFGVDGVTEKVEDYTYA